MYYSNIIKCYIRIKTNIAIKDLLSQPQRNTCVLASNITLKPSTTRNEDKFLVGNGADCSPVRRRVKSQPQAMSVTLWFRMGQCWRVAMSPLWPSPSWPLLFCPHTNTWPLSVQHGNNQRFYLDVLFLGQLHLYTHSRHLLKKTRLNWVEVCFYHLLLDHS